MLSSSCDICVLSWSLLSDDLLVRVEYVGVTCEIGQGGKRFNFDLGMERLKGRLGKCRWTGFRVSKFIGCFDIGVVELGDGVIYCCVRISI